MMQACLCFDRPRAGDLFLAGSQNYRIYERLVEGPLTNVEIVRGMGIFNSTGRVSEIREAVRKFGIDVEARPDANRKGVWIYRLRG